MVYTVRLWGKVNMNCDTSELNLEENGSDAWIEVGNILVHVLRTEEGVICDMYDMDKCTDDMHAAQLAACYAFFNEATGDSEFKRARDAKKIELDLLDKALDD